MNFETIYKELLSYGDQKKGMPFEELVCPWILKNFPTYKNKIKQVWQFKKWPKRWGKDTGTDLIAETFDGKIWAIQAKCYNENYYIKQEDVDSFLADSSREIIDYRLIIATTNKLGSNAINEIEGQEKLVGSVLYSAKKDGEIFLGLDERNKSDISVLAGIKDGNPRFFYVVPTLLIDKQIKEHHSAWMATPRKDGSKHKDSTLRQIIFDDNTDRISRGYKVKWKSYKNNWELLKEIK